MKILFLLLAILVQQVPQAQQKAAFVSQEYVGMVQGERGASIQVQSINGVKIKSWFAGLGAAVDWYYRRSIPVFASGSKDIVHWNRNKIFVTANSGINIPWQEKDLINEWGYKESKSYSGLYWSAGLGYQRKIGKKDRGLLVKVDYNFKKVREKIAYPMVFDDDRDPSDVFTFGLKTYGFRIGWSF